ncbi:MAG: SDR family oxidoreductase [Streptosporangiaceae bacterium]|nr:SDR family oxidoreductase [Streptosporangiaceae bacterium]
MRGDPPPAPPLGRLPDLPPFDFSHRVVLVTGGTRGIGRVIAESFLSAGARVVVCARGEPESLPSGMLFVAADLRDPDQAAGVVARAVESYGRLDVLVNNAGGSPAADAATVSPRFVEKIVALNLLAPFYVAQPANAVMQGQGSGGVIVNIGSVAAHQAEPQSAPYAAAKAGLLQLTRALALEWAPKVRVNHITAGLIMTERSAGFYGPDGGASVAQVIPMGRMALPSDVAGACLYLASPLAAYLTGVDLPVHGGGEIPARYLAAHKAETAADPVRIRGPRLLLRPLRPAEIDAEWHAMLTADPMTVGGPPADEAAFRARLARSGHMRDGWLDLAIDVDGRHIGRIQTFVPPGRELPPGTFDIGIGLVPEARGRGYGTEALALLTGWLFEHAAAEVVEAGTDPANAPMRAVFQRSGWTQAGQLTEIGREWLMYQITRSDWQSRDR